MASSNNLVSFLVSEQVPDFVRDDHPNFVNFVKAYYEFLEQNTGPIYRSKNLNYYNDIDESLDEFVEYLRREFAEGLPTSILGDKRLVIKFIKDLYRRKGSREAYKFLFRELYGEEIDLDFPGEDVIKASDSVWERDIKLRVIETDAVKADRLLFSEGVTVIGTSTSANAIISGSVTKVINGQEILELDLATLNGQFSSNDSIKFTDSLETYPLANVIGAITINDGGSFYTVNDTATASIGGKLGKLRVTAVDSENSNAIQTMVVDDFGASFSGVPTVTFDDGNNSANVTVAITGTALFEGAYTDTRSLVSESTTKLFDGVKYQYYSYIIRVGLSIDTYKNIVKELIHPAGMELFGEVTIRSTLNGRILRSVGNAFPTGASPYKLMSIILAATPVNAQANVQPLFYDKEFALRTFVSANSQIQITSPFEVETRPEVIASLYSSNNYSQILGVANRNKVLDPEFTSSPITIGNWKSDQITGFSDRPISLFPGLTKAIARSSSIDLESV